jgi:hypothetical protein
MRLSAYIQVATMTTMEQQAVLPRDTILYFRKD